MDTLHPPVSPAVDYGSVTKLSPVEYEYDGYVPSLVQGQSRSMPPSYTPSTSLAGMETTTASFDTTIEGTPPEFA